MRRKEVQAEIENDNDGNWIYAEEMEMEEKAV